MRRGFGYLLVGNMEIGKLSDESTRPRGFFFSIFYVLSCWDYANKIMYIFTWMPSPYRGNQADPY